MSDFLSRAQVKGILEALPASCVGDAIDKINPQPSIYRALFFLRNCEAEGLVTWRRDAGNSEIALTDKGRDALKSHTASPAVPS